MALETACNQLHDRLAEVADAVAQLCKTLESPRAGQRTMLIQEFTHHATELTGLAEHAVAETQRARDAATQREGFETASQALTETDEMLGQIEKVIGTELFRIDRIENLLAHRARGPQWTRWVDEAAIHDLELVRDMAQRAREAARACWAEVLERAKYQTVSVTSIGQQIYATPEERTLARDVAR